jgi:hypothetical protein
MIFDTLRAAFSDAAVTVDVVIDPNTTVTVNGLRSNQTIARTIMKGTGLSDNIDTGIIVPTATLGDVSALRGKRLTVEGVKHTIIQTRLHALGGLVHFQLGEYDRVTA